MIFLKKNFFLLFLIFFFWFSSLAGAEYQSSAANTARLLSDLEIKAGEVNSVQADFLQTRHLSIFSKELKSSGRMILRKPDSLRWEYFEPVQSGFAVSRGKGLRWNSLAQEVKEFSVKDDPVMQIVVDQLMAWSRVDLKKQENDFQITVINDDPVQISLVPKSEDLRNFLKEVVLFFAPDRKSIQEVQVREKGVDYTQIAFLHPVLNGAIAESLFTEKAR